MDEILNPLKKVLPAHEAIIRRISSHVMNTALGYP